MAEVRAQLWCDIIVPIFPLRTGIGRMNLSPAYWGDGVLTGGRRLR